VTLDDAARAYADAAAPVDAAEQAYSAAVTALVAARRTAGSCGGMGLSSAAVTAAREVCDRAQGRLARVRAAERAALSVLAAAAVAGYGAPTLFDEAAA